MKNNRKGKKYQKPVLKAVKFKDINIKAMTNYNGQFCMMTAGGGCHV